ncbi:DUF411 domain-containing protein [Aliagarivorans marinus]|uniref:DUF411 domain-containing protein n=1 Tax=Aliagarivorans marinus TaxID=561965 RepID=UPI00040AFE67|nr:DUF411 domain-containing protein [Aliagarivorans marinus]
MAIRFSAALLAAAFSFSSAATEVLLYKSPSCGCCQEWADILEGKGYQVKVQTERDWSEVRRAHGLPPQALSCHSAIIDGYLIEGHVPVADIKRLLAERPEHIAGLSAPGMPMHSPGMAAPGEVYRDFDVVSFDKDGKLTLFNAY